MTGTPTREFALLKPLAWPTYLAGGLMVALSLMDLVTSIWPLQIGEVQWRYGAWGLLSGFTLTPLLGAFMLAAAAALLGHARVLRALWWAYLATAIMLGLGSALFVLDVLQVRGSVAEGERARFDVGVAKALLKHVTVLAAVLWLGRSCRSAAREGRTGQRRVSAPDVLLEPAKDPRREPAR
jgi:hypothetical protein